MEKPVEFYQSMNLSEAAKEIALAGPARSELPAFLDAINAMYFLSKAQVVSVEELHSVLSAPDVIQSLPGGNEAHGYSWVGAVHGSAVRSQTLFLVSAGKVVGLHKESGQ